MKESVKQYKSEGYQEFQLKVGGYYQEDIERIKQVDSILNDNNILVADANTGWKLMGT